MDTILDACKTLNIAQLAAIGIMFWFFYSRLDDKIEKLDKKVDRLDEKVTDIDRRVCRMEGSLNSKECCMLKDSRLKEKAD